MRLVTAHLLAKVGSVPGGRRHYVVYPIISFVFNCSYSQAYIFLFHWLLSFHFRTSYFFFFFFLALSMVNPGRQQNWAWRFATFV
jgi:hypothetical protein